MPAKKNEEERRNDVDGEQFEGAEQEHEEEREDDKQLDLEEEGEEGEEEDVKHDEDDEDKDEEEEEEEEGDPKGRSSPSASEENSKYMFVDLSEIRKDVQCPICLGIIKKTRTVMDCLHRFCRECIDKSMRLGNNECPACRKHCASRRSLRDDPRFDSLIAILYPNIDKYEEEELAFHEEEKARNKQIQESIAEISQRQSEALVKRRSLGKEAAVLARSQRNSCSRRKRNSRNADHQASEAHDNNNDDNDNNRGKDSSSADERCTEFRQRKRRRSGGHLSHPSSSGANNNNNNNNNNIVGCNENDLDTYRQSRGISQGLVWNPELLAWGKGGTRSHTRHGNAPGGSSKSVRNARLTRLVEYLRSLRGNNVELDIHLKLISLDTQSAPSLQQLYLCCRPSLLVKQLREYIALKINLQAGDIELLMAKGQEDAVENQSIKISSISTNEMQSLKDDESLAALKLDCHSSHNHLIVVYGQKQRE